MTNRTSLPLAVGLVLTLAAVAPASVINIDVQNGGTVLTETGLAGAPDPQGAAAFWNAPNQLAANFPLVESDGSTFAGLLTFGGLSPNPNNNDGSNSVLSSDTYNPAGNETSAGQPNVTNLLLDDYVFDSDTFTLSFTGLTPGAYEVYAYTPGDVGGPSAIFGIGIAEGVFADLASARAAGVAAIPTTANPGGYIQGEHYALLGGVAVPGSGALTLTAYNADDGSSLGVLAGLQLVRVPEPLSLALVAAATLAMPLRRRAS